MTWTPNLFIDHCLPYAHLPGSSGFKCNSSVRLPHKLLTELARAVGNNLQGGLVSKLEFGLKVDHDIGLVTLLEILKHIVC
jgi:hypothetical protein